MNEFTREELLILLKGYETGCYYEGFRCSQKLIVKLEDMIENYCDHLWTDGSGNTICCARCHMIWGKR